MVGPVLLTLATDVARSQAPKPPDHWPRVTATVDAADLVTTLVDLPAHLSALNAHLGEHGNY